jgi:hypothetical protein
MLAILATLVLASANTCADFNYDVGVAIRGYKDLNASIEESQIGSDDVETSLKVLQHELDVGQQDMGGCPVTARSRDDFQAFYVLRWHAADVNMQMHALQTRQDSQYNDPSLTGTDETILKTDLTAERSAIAELRLLHYDRTNAADFRTLEAATQTAAQTLGFP